MLDEEEIYELVGTYLLNQLANIIDKDSNGFYRDDRLGVLRKIPSPETDSRKESIIKFFKDCGLGKAFQANLRIVNFLDFQFILDRGTYQSNKKPDVNPAYIKENLNNLVAVYS